MKRWKSALGVLLVFLLGLFSGAALATFLHFRAFPRPDLPDRMAAFAVRQLARELDLDEHQQQVVREAMEESSRELGALRQEMGPRMDQVFERARKKIEDSLRPEQRRRLQEMVRERRELMHRLFGGPRFGPPGGGRL